MKNIFLTNNKFFIAAIASTIVLSVGCTKNEEAKKMDAATAQPAAAAPGTPASTTTTATKAPEVKDLLMQEIKTGTGKEVKDGMTAVVQYRGTFLDGKEFDSSYSRNKPFEFKVGAKQVIEGWDIGLKGMKVGGKRLLVVPATMAYGEKGAGPIPPNTALKFEIELVDLKR